MLAARSSMVPGSTPFTVCVSVASVSAFIALVAIVLILVWLWLRQVSPQERDELEGEIADLRRRLREAQNQEESRSSTPQNHRIPRLQRQGDELKRTKEELASKRGELSNAWELISNLQQKLESLSRELDPERKQSEALSKQSERKRAAEEPGTKMQAQVDQLEHLRSQINDLKTENAQLKAQDRASRKRSTETKQNDPGMQNGAERDQLHRANRALQGKEELRRAPQTNEALSTQLASMSREWETKMDDERKRYQDLFTRNQRLQDDLKGARKYGSTEDRYAGAEVVDLVEKLNSDILQVAATVAEGLDVDEWANNRQSVDNTNGSNADNLATFIGRDLTRLLRASESQDLNIVLQTAFQASMTYHTILITSSWCYRFPQEERLFDESYRSMRRDELQAVSGRWRQLAMTHLKGSRSAYEQHLMPRLASTLTDIVVATGYRQDPAIVRKQITDRFASRLQDVIKAAQDLHRVIGEEVTSSDLEVVWPRPGTSYDPGIMEDTFGPTSVNDEEEVACVTDVGLRSKEVPGSTKKKPSVLLKAKVLLPSGLAGIRVRDT